MKSISLSLLLIASSTCLASVEGRYDAAQARNISNHAPLSMLQVHPTQKGPRVEAIFHNYSSRTPVTSRKEATKTQKKVEDIDEPSKASYLEQKVNSPLGDDFIDENEDRFDENENENGFDEDEDEDGFDENGNGFDENGNEFDENENGFEDEFEDEFDESKNEFDENEDRFDEDGSDDTDMTKAVASDSPVYKEMGDLNKNYDVALEDDNEDEEASLSENEINDEFNPEGEYETDAEL